MDQLKLAKNLARFGLVASMLIQTPRKVIRDAHVALALGFPLEDIHRDHKKLVEMRGFEPLTSSLRTRRSPN